MQFQKVRCRNWYPCPYNGIKSVVAKKGEKEDLEEIFLQKTRRPDGTTEQTSLQRVLYHFCVFGKARVKVAPPPGVSVAVREAPCNRASSFATESPKPKLRLLVRLASAR